MTQESRFKIEPLLKLLFSVLAESGLLEMQRAEHDGAKKSSGEMEFLREVIGELLKKAGKSKDEVVRVVAKEIGMAVAAMMEKPVQQILKSHKIQVSVEFLPKESSGSRQDLAGKQQKSSSKTGKAAPAKKRSRKKAGA